jgi:hypothetical protein
MDLFTLDTLPSSLHLPKLESEFNDLDEFNEKSNVVSIYNEWIPYHINQCLIKNGTCHFDIISEALKKSKNKISSKKLRKLLFDHLSTNNLEFKQSRNIKTKKELKKFMDTFDGDNDTLNILSKLLNIDFYIFEQNSQLPIEISTGNNDIILLDTFSPGTIGLKSTSKIPQTLFNRSSLPFTLESLLDKNIYFKNKITEFYNTVPKKDFTLINLYNYINLNKKLSIDDKKLVLDLIKDLIKTVKLNSHKIKYKIKINLDSLKKSESIQNSVKSFKKSIKLSLKKLSPKKLSHKSLSKKSVKKLSHKSLSKKSLSKKSVKKLFKSLSKKSVKKLYKSLSKKSVKKLFKSLSKKSVKKLHKSLKKSLKLSHKKSKKNKLKEKVRVLRPIKKRVLRPIKK